MRLKKILGKRLKRKRQSDEKKIKGGEIKRGRARNKDGGKERITCSKASHSRWLCSSDCFKLFL